MGGKLRTENHPKVILGIREHSLLKYDKTIDHIRGRETQSNTSKGFHEQR